MFQKPDNRTPGRPPEVPAALHQETNAMFAEAATRVGLIYAASLTLLVVLMHVVS